MAHRYTSDEAFINAKHGHGSASARGGEMRRHFQVHLHLTNLCCQWKAAPDERDVSPPESATKVGGKCVIEPLKSGEPCQLLEKVEPGLQPAWRASHANWKGHKWLWSTFPRIPSSLRVPGASVGFVQLQTEWPSTRVIENATQSTSRSHMTTTFKSLSFMQDSIWVTLCDELYMKMKSVFLQHTLSESGGRRQNETWPALNKTEIL